MGTGRIFKITKGGFKRATDKACDRAGIPRWAPNQPRHAAGTEIRKEYGLEAAQVILGHAKADVTQVYAEANMGRGATSPERSAEPLQALPSPGPPARTGEPGARSPFAYFAHGS